MSLAELLGGSTRASVVESLSLTDRPLTAYRIAKSCNLNVAKVYLEARRLVKLGLVKAKRGKRGVEYALADEDLRRLALRLSPRTLSYDAWSAEGAKRARFRAGLAAVPRGVSRRPSLGAESKPTRMPGELENLAALARKRFDAKYRRRAPNVYARV